MNDLSAMERRITLRLIAYWERLRAGRDMPAENDINPDDLQDLWDHCFLIQVKRSDKADYDYAYLGAALQAVSTSMGVDEFGGFIQKNAHKLADDYHKVIATAQPLLDEGEFIAGSRQVVKYRHCLLPLGQQGQVEAIFGGIKFKIFPQN